MGNKKLYVGDDVAVELDPVSKHLIIYDRGIEQVETPLGKADHEDVTHDYRVSFSDLKKMKDAKFSIYFTRLNEEVKARVMFRGGLMLNNMENEVITFFTKEEFEEIKQYLD